MDKCGGWIKGGGGWIKCQILYPVPSPTKVIQWLVDTYKPWNSVNEIPSHIRAKLSLDGRSHGHLNEVMAGIIPYFIKGVNPRSSKSVFPLALYKGMNDDMCFGG